MFLKSKTELKSKSVAEKSIEGVCTFLYPLMSK